MKKIDVLTLAWKIFKNSKTFNKFSKALKFAWKILKQSTITLENNYITIISKTIKNMKLFIAENVNNKTIKFEDNDYNINLFSYELNRNFSY